MMLEPLPHQASHVMQQEAADLGGTVQQSPVSFLSQLMICELDNKQAYNSQYLL
jgi:hypothetical protein